MLIMAWAAIAIAFGLLVAWVAHCKGRELVPWWFYGTVAGVIALPHALLLPPRLEERRWTPIRFGLPSGPQACPFCHARIHADAVVCRHCGSGLYGAPDVAVDAAHDRPTPAPATARAQPSQGTVQQDLFSEERLCEAADAGSRRLDATIPENVDAGPHMVIPPPPPRQPSIFGQFALIMMLCAATALGTLWLTGPHLQDRDFRPAEDGEEPSVQDRIISRPHAFLPPPRGDATVEATRPKATGKPLALDPPARPTAMAPEPLEAPSFPPRDAVPDPGLVSDSTPQNLPVATNPPLPSSPTPPSDLVKDVKSALGKLKRKSKREGDGGGSANDEDGEGRIIASGEMVKDLQHRLRAEGFNPGTIDGKAGSQTMQAMRAFQRKSGLPETENISRAVLVRLGIMQPGTPKMVLQVERPVPAEAGNAEAAAHDRINIE